MSYYELLDFVNEGRGGYVEVDADEIDLAWDLMRSRGFCETDPYPKVEGMSYYEECAFIEKHYLEIQPADDSDSRYYRLRSI